MSGIGHGSSLPPLSNATGRPAMDDSFTVEITGKGCCPATTGATKKIAMNALANPAFFFMSGQYHLQVYAANCSSRQMTVISLAAVVPTSID